MVHEQPITLVSAVSAELGELPGHAMGIGPLHAAIGASLALAGGRGPVVLVGSAGFYPGHGLEIGDVVACSSLGLSRGIAEVKLGYQPIEPEVLQGESTILPKLIRARVLTVEAITSDPKLTQRRGQTWQVEHMESYAVALVCARLGRPFLAVLGLSNQVGPQAHAQWLAHRVQAETAARQAVSQLFSPTK
ncbi:MAG: nucleoside phosphorylase [Cognaticolwellia sp.]|jgi:nucleoside phosphorylase